MQILHKLACKRKNIVSFKDMLQNLFNFEAAAVLDKKHYFFAKTKKKCWKRKWRIFKRKNSKEST